MKEYVFENTLNSNIRISVKAENLPEAVSVLMIELKDPEDYQQIKP